MVKGIYAGVRQAARARRVQVAFYASRQSKESEAVAAVSASYFFGVRCDAFLRGGYIIKKDMLNKRRGTRSD